MPIFNGLDIVKMLTGVEYNWIDTSAKSAGLIADDVEKVLPHIVTQENGNKSINYSAIIPYLIEAIKKQQITIDNLVNTINGLTKNDNTSS